MYTKDKTQRITLRLNEQQFAFVGTICEALGVSPSEYLRMMINLAMSSAKKADSATDMAKSTANFIEEVQRRENEQTDINSLV